MPGAIDRPTLREALHRDEEARAAARIKTMNGPPPHKRKPSLREAISTEIEDQFREAGQGH